jgi:serine acetyltransferase
LLIPSPSGITISGKAGDNLSALALAGFGGSVRDYDIGGGIGQPVVGDNVTANQFTGIQGSIRLGDGVIVDFGAGAVVSVEDNARMVLAVEPRAGDLPAAAPRRDCDPPRCQHAEWRRTRAAFDQDVARYLDELAQYAPPGGKRPGKLGAILTNSLLALAIYRLSHWLSMNGHPWLALKVCQFNILFHKLTIPPGSCLAGGVLMPHLAGTIVNCRAGGNLTLYANSLCMGTGNALTETIAVSPSLGDKVTIGGHSGIFGPVDVGNGVQLGPKAQLAQDVAENTQVWSSMARGTDRPRGVEAIDSPAAGAPKAGAATVRSRRLGTDRPWRETCDRLTRDRLRLWETVEPGGPRPPYYPALVCAALFRLSHYFHCTGFRRGARWIWMANVYLTGADIAPCCEIGGGLLIPHPAGIALHCRSGDSLTVMATTGIAASLDSEDRLKDLDETPQLGDKVFLAHHSGIYGGITIGDGVHISSGCIVTRATADGVTLVPRSLKFRGPAAAGRQRPRTGTTAPANDAGADAQSDMAPHCPDAGIAEIQSRDREAPGT